MPRRSPSVPTLALLGAALVASPATAQIVFEPPQPYAAPAIVIDFRHLTLGDVDGDGVPDVVVSDGLFGDDVHLMRGTGDGQLQPAELLDPPFGDGLVLSDVDGDGDPDLLSWLDGDVYLFPGAGDGTFTAPSVVHDTDPVSIFGLPQPLALVIEAGDLTGDGVPDLLVSQGMLFAGGVLLSRAGNGDGTFGPEQTIGDSGHSGAQFGRPRLADLDGDGDTDIVVPVGYLEEVRTYLADGTGGWTVGTVGFAFEPGIGLAVGDVDGDAIPDIVATAADRNLVMVASGHGDGTFASSVSYPTGTTPRDVAIVDLDVDGVADLVTANLHSTDMTALRGQGDGTFELGVTVSGLVNANLVLPADFDADGFPDLVTGGSSGTDEVVEVLLNHTYGEDEAFEDKGHASSGSAGFPIHLASGSLDAGASVTFSLRNAAANRPTWLVIGLSAIDASFKGGTLVPAPDLLFGPFTSDGLGAVDAAGSWPSGLPSEVNFYLQYWISDPGAPFGFSAGSAIAATTP